MNKKKIIVGLLVSLFCFIVYLSPQTKIGLSRESPVVYADTNTVAANGDSGMGKDKAAAAATDNSTDDSDSTAGIFQTTTGAKLSEVNQPLETWSPDAWKMASQTLFSATYQTGIYVMLFFMIFEMTTIFQDANTNNDGKVAPNTIMMAIVKYLLVGALIGISALVFQFIIQIAAGSVNLIIAQTKDLVIQPGVDLPKALTALDLVADPLKFIASLVGWLISTIIITIAGLAVWFVVFSRYFMLYVLVALAPIPLATLCSREYKSIGIGYFKFFAAYAFQGLVLGVIYAIYSIIEKNLSSSTALSGNPFNNTLVSLIFLVAVIQSLTLSKKLTGAI